MKRPQRSPVSSVLAGVSEKASKRFVALNRALAAKTIVGSEAAIAAAVALRLQQFADAVKARLPHLKEISVSLRGGACRFNVGAWFFGEFVMGIGTTLDEAIGELARKSDVKCMVRDLRERANELERMAS